MNGELSSDATRALGGGVYVHLPPGRPLGFLMWRDQRADAKTREIPRDFRVWRVTAGMCVGRLAPLNAPFIF